MAWFASKNSEGSTVASWPSAWGKGGAGRHPNGLLLRSAAFGKHGSFCEHPSLYIGKLCAILTYEEQIVLNIPPLARN